MTVLREEVARLPSLENYGILVRVSQGLIGLHKVPSLMGLLIRGRAVSPSDSLQYKKFLNLRSVVLAPRLTTKW